MSSALPVRNIALFILPVTYVAGAFVLRDIAGPFWNWHTADPSYFYLFDALSLRGFEAPGHPFHPGTPVQLLAALILWLRHPFMDQRTLVDRVLDDPEAYLHLISTIFVAITGILLVWLGRQVFSRTQDLFLAMISQLSPFLSMVIYKNSYHVKPEAALIALMVIWAGVVILFVLRSDPERVGWRFTLGFGVLAGLGVAIKITATPIFIMAAVLIGMRREVLYFGVIALLTLCIATLPAWPTLHLAFDFTKDTLTTVGAYDTGVRGVIDWETYPATVLKLLRRPIVAAPFILCLICVAVVWARARRQLFVPKHIARALVSILIALSAMALVIAKQPTANYMLPAYMLCGLTIVFVILFVRSLRQHGVVQPIGWPWGAAIILAVGVVAQTFAVIGEASELAEKRQGFEAEARNTDHLTCTRLYFFSASTLEWALPMSDWRTGLRFADQVSARIPVNVYWLELETGFRNAFGPVNIKPVLDQARCVVARGSVGHQGSLYEHLKAIAPDVTFDKTCPARDSHIAVRNVAC